MRVPLRSILLITTLAASCLFGANRAHRRDTSGRQAKVAMVYPDHDQGKWEGWGSSLAWWGRAIGGTGNADYYADLIYTLKSVDGYPGLGLNVVRYNVGGGGINQPRENKGPKLKWQMDIHGYWVDPNTEDPNSPSWNWAADLNQRTMMLKARERGADVFELFSDSPMWWMNSNSSTAGSDSGGDCLAPANYERFAVYLATVARYAADHWGVKFHSVEPFNEPSADWWKYPQRQEGCHFDIATQKVILEKLRQALDRGQLSEVPIAASDENDVDVALHTWSAFDTATRAMVGKVNVHGYYRGTHPYRGSNRNTLRQAAGDKDIWQSEYGGPDGSGFEMAQSIILDVREFKPRAWVYWQPVEPESGWGFINATYVDTGDQIKPETRTDLVRVNRKFFVFGQFTRYVRPGFHIIEINDPNSIAAYDESERKLVIVTVTGADRVSIRYDLSKFNAAGRVVQRIATTTAPGGEVPDWKQHSDRLSFDPAKKTYTSDLYPRSVYTFVLEEVSRTTGPGGSRRLR
ncbi:MAG: beta-1,6-galactanase [Acidobacteria bacterium]|nr:MAG: beta-1,6-galactanase [Acidobacteriota bacterium]